jgi:glutamyl-Q tRNA(Asp) synthetase
VDEETVPAFIGRFAPSPTGPLHFGSLVAALASYLDARAVGGKWLVRIEDVDEPRTVPGAADCILRCLEAYGMQWDETVVYQSHRKPLYQQALEALGDRVFPCGCSRVTGIYPGTCRNGLPLGKLARAWRLRVPGDVTIRFEDRIRGPQSDALAVTTGDFVLRRADGLFAYQLAVVVDDAEQRITDVVRGEDLLDSTGRQILLQELLGYGRPRYAHIPVVRDPATGDKLSKQTLAPPVDPAGDEATFRKALAFLGIHGDWSIRDLRDGDLPRSGWTADRLALKDQ